MRCSYLVTPCAHAPPHWCKENHCGTRGRSAALAAPTHHTGRRPWRRGWVPRSNWESPNRARTTPTRSHHVVSLAVIPPLVIISVHHSASEPHPRFTTINPRVFITKRCTDPAPTSTFFHATKTQQHHMLRVPACMHSAAVVCHGLTRPSSMGPSGFLT